MTNHLHCGHTEVTKCMNILYSWEGNFLVFDKQTKSFQVAGSSFLLTSLKNVFVDVVMLNEANRSM